MYTQSCTQVFCASENAVFAYVYIIMRFGMHQLWPSLLHLKFIYKISNGRKQHDSHDALKPNDFWREIKEKIKNKVFGNVTQTTTRLNRFIVEKIM